MNIVLASNNGGKINEIQALLTGHTILPQSHFTISEAEETGLTFVENAIIKARHAARLSDLPTIADDSGLIVDALNGAPGVISARYAGVGCSDADNNAKLLRELAEIPDTQRQARFVCVMVFMQHTNDPFPLIAQGVWEGSIARQVSGQNGFGYDPVFWLTEQNCTSAQLPSDVKNLFSHRGQAVRQLIALLKQTLDG
jgi:XTP/dITP diphosphohydrolase